MSNAETQKTRKKFKWQQLLFMLFYVLIGAACGIMAIHYIEPLMNQGRTVWDKLLPFLGLLAGMYLSILLQIIIHEAGHLVFGLFTGYTFSSFRIFSFMWMKENGKLKLRRLSLAGTAGQCLMNPPDLKDGRIPFLLYNLGGAIMNLLTALLFFLLSLICSPLPFLSLFLKMLSVIGVVSALMNGLPLHLGTVDNDGCNTVNLLKNPDAVRAFWVQMKVNDQTARNIRIRDMPEEWFTIPPDETLKNTLCVVPAILACNRLMDQHRFEEADQAMEHLLAIESGINDIHRCLLICDRVYIELIGKNRTAELDTFMSKEQLKLMKALKTLLPIPRTDYLMALLHEKNPEKAETCKQRFEQVARHYPYISDLESERELIEIAEKKAKESTGQQNPA